MKVFALVAGFATASFAQTAAAPAATPVSSVPEVSFQFERIGLPVPRFTLAVHEDGTGTYQAQVASVSGSTDAVGQVNASGPPVNRAIRLSPSTTETIFKTARSLDRFNIECASKAKNIADTGKKTLSYTGADGQGACRYNYSDNKSVAQLTSLFQAIAFTMDEGRKLEFLHRFDRLGLYSEMDSLGHEVEEKRALELGNIAPALKAIVSDEALMQRVREKAAKLLAQAEEAK